MALSELAFRELKKKTLSLEGKDCKAKQIKQTGKQKDAAFEAFCILFGKYQESFDL